LVNWICSYTLAHWLGEQAYPFSWVYPFMLSTGRGQLLKCYIRFEYKNRQKGNVVPVHAMKSCM